MSGLFSRAAMKLAGRDRAVYACHLRDVVAPAVVRDERDVGEGRRPGARHGIDPRRNTGIERGQPLTLGSRHPAARDHPRRQATNAFSPSPHTVASDEVVNSGDISIEIKTGTFPTSFDKGS